MEHSHDLLEFHELCSHSIEPAKPWPPSMLLNVVGRQTALNSAKTHQTSEYLFLQLRVVDCHLVEAMKLLTDRAPSHFETGGTNNVACNYANFLNAAICDMGILATTLR